MSICRPRTLLCAITFAFCSAAVPAAASEKYSESGASNRSWALGVAQVAQQMPYIGVKDQQLLVPVLLLKSRWIDMDGTGIALKLPLDGPVQFSIRGSASPLEGYKSSDSSALYGMGERSNPILLGPSISWETRPVLLSLMIAHDVSGHSNGNQVRVQAEHTFKTGKWSLTPRIAEIWLDNSYVDYFYGVRSEEATTARREYHPTQTSNHEIGLGLTRLIGDHHTLFVDVSHTGMGSEIGNSPIVDDNARVTTAVAGYVYRF